MALPGVTVRAVEKASVHYSAHLQVGRRLKGRLLAVAVLLRNLILVAATFGFLWDVEHLAPAWVVVTQKGDGRVVGKFAAGRWAGQGERLLDEVNEDLAVMPVASFRQKYPALTKVTGPAESQSG